MAKYRINTANQAETEKFAEHFGGQLRGGEVIVLVGDVGAGKTTFMRGLARGAGSKDRVSSPTFTVSNIYSSPKINLYHYDFYRLDDFQIIKGELEEVISMPNNSVILEWAEEVESTLPEDHIKINIVTTSQDGRNFKIFIPEKFNYRKVEE
jgi:tRNA threonylcarbamoyladenosine biosynthesis protein TsaE